MALIDKETVRKEIERLEEMDYPCDTFEQSEGFYDALDRVKSFLDTLPEQLVEGLEYEIKLYFDGWSDDTEYRQAVNEKGVCVGVEDCEDIARHFAEWGAGHAKQLSDEQEKDKDK